MDPNKTVILTANEKPLPWKGGDAAYGKRKMLLKSLTDIPGILRKIAAKPESGIKYVVVEDHTHFQNQILLSQKFFAEGLASNTKFSRWEDFGRLVYSSIFELERELPSDMIIFVLAHVADDGSGNKVFKTFGKMVGNTVDPVSYANVVLHAMVMGNEEKKSERYKFLTSSDGVHEAKSPMGMFDEDYIPNDLALVIKAMEEYAKPPAKEGAQSKTKK